MPIMNPKLEAIRFKCISHLGKVGKETYTYYSSLSYKELLKLYWKSLDIEKLSEAPKEEPKPFKCKYPNNTEMLKTALSYSSKRKEESTKDDSTIFPY